MKLTTTTAARRAARFLRVASVMLPCVVALSHAQPMPVDVARPMAVSIPELLLPSFLRIGYQTRAWVRESLPPANDSLDDLARMDLIYLRALHEANGDIGIALFASMVATFEHRTIPLSFGIHLPLTLEPEDLFDRRVAVLPRHLFLDRPVGDDRDKLQHFFASAWLAWGLDSRRIADAIGLGVEVGEDLFVKGGLNDRRDVRANRLGHLFVEMLRLQPDARPSAIIRAWNREYARRAGEAR